MSQHSAHDSPRLSLLLDFASKMLALLTLNQTNYFPPPFSPRSSEDTLLPMSASPGTTVFSDPFEKVAVQPTPRSRSWPSMHAPILLVIILFPLSTALVFFTLSTLPVTASWPHTISDLAQLARELLSYSQSGPSAMAHITSVLAVTAIYKHAWSIPGSVLWNVLGGVLFTPLYGTLLLTALTTIGSLLATLLAKPLAPLITAFFPRILDMGRAALEGGSDSALATRSRGSAWQRLSVLRLIGVVPWSGINIACGVCGVSLYDCALGTFIGTLPWTAVTCQVGDILQTVASSPSPSPQSISSLLASPSIIGKLVFLSFLSLAPILGRERLNALLSSPDEERVARWRWVQDWRTKIRKPSQERALARENELQELVREKRREASDDA